MGPQEPWGYGACAGRGRGGRVPCARSLALGGGGWPRGRAAPEAPRPSEQSAAKAGPRSEPRPCRARRCGLQDVPPRRWVADVERGRSAPGEGVRGARRPPRPLALLPANAREERHAPVPRDTRRGPSRAHANGGHRVQSMRPGLPPCRACGSSVAVPALQGPAGSREGEPPRKALSPRAPLASSP